MRAPEDLHEFVSIGEVAEAAGVSFSTAWRWHRDGLLPGAVRVAGRLVFRRAAIAEFLEHGRAGLMSLKQAAAYVGRSPRTIRRCVESGRLASTSPTRTLFFFTRDAVDELVQQAAAMAAIPRHSAVIRSAVAKLGARQAG